MDELRRLLVGYQVSQGLHVLATLRIPDLLADGPRAGGDLAYAVGPDHDALDRLLRAVARVGVLTPEADGTFALSPLGSRLRTDVPGSLHAYAAHLGRPYHWNALSGLLGSVCTGEPAFPRLQGRTVWEYRAEHPEDAALF